jgi:hypothetical protein
MRRAYIGLSSPVAYDYSNTFRVGIGSDVDFEPEFPYWAQYNALPYPTPILESPFGLLLLYDEIWFLSRALCPADMQDLPYIHFILETDYIENVYGKYVDYRSKTVSEVIANEYFNITLSCKDVVADIKGSLPINWDAQLSDLSEIFMVSGMGCFGYSGKLETLLIDLVFMSHFGISGLELITNRFTSRMLECLSYETLEHSNLATAVEPILIDNIPNYLTQNGCYHPSIEEARADQFLSDFRKWLATFPKSVTPNEVREIAEDARNKLKLMQNEIFVRYLSSNSYYLATGKGLLNAAVDLLLPGVGTGLGALDAALAGRKAEKIRWLGFMSNQAIRANKTIQPTR